MTAQMFAFDNSYAELPERLFVRLAPTPVTRPGLIRINDTLAEALGLDANALSSPEGVNVLAGNAVADGADPLAMAYAGHQFGSWNPQLGDGRALLLGEVIGNDGLRYDIQLKGSGPTPFSRMGDGRAWLGPVLREYLVSEAMFALGVPTTRALAAVSTGDQVFREEGALPGAVLTRVSRAHIRVGTFQFFAARGDTDALRALTDHAIARLYPEAAAAENPALALLDCVIEAQANLVSKWMNLGFIHGVMNTDNMSIAGETIDYGPCAFMDTFHPDTVFSFIDRMGRYAYRNQPGIAQWNLANLAQSLLPLIDEKQDRALELAQESVDRFAAMFEERHNAGLARKIGLSELHEDDVELAGNLLAAMARNQVDFTNLFRGLCEIADPDADGSGDSAVRDLFVDPTEFDSWAKAWHARLRSDNRDVETRRADMRSVNPAIIPRNHLVEAAIQAAHKDQDFSLFHRLSEALATPFADPSDQSFTRPPEPDQIVQNTFCGT